jgi:hypothetical protein
MANNIVGMREQLAILKNKKKGDISDTDLLAILSSLKNKYIHDIDTLTKLCCIIIKLIKNVSSLTEYVKIILIKINIGNCYKDYLLEILNTLIQVKYIFNKSEITFLYKLYFINNLLKILYEIHKLSPDLKIDFNKLSHNIPLNYYFLNENFEKFKEIYNYFKLDLNVLNLALSVRYYYEDPLNNEMEKFIEILSNFIKFLKENNIKFDNNFLYNFIIDNYNQIKSGKIDKLFIEMNKYYTGEKIPKKHLILLIERINKNKYYDDDVYANLSDKEIVKNKSIWKTLIEKCNLSLEKINLDEFDNPIIYKYICHYCSCSVYEKYFPTFETFIKNFYEGEVDNNFIEKILFICNKYADKKNYFTIILQKINPNLINEDYLKKCLYYNTDITPFLENKVMISEEFILNYNYNNLEEILKNCTKYGQYFSENIIDHVVLNFFSSDVKANKSKIKKNKVNFMLKSYDENFCERVQKITIYINDSLNFDKYKKKIKEILNLYKKIYYMNTYDMIEYIKSNDITHNIILIMSLDNTLKDLQLCMKVYFDKIANKKVIVKKVVKKILKD